VIRPVTRVVLKPGRAVGSATGRCPACTDHTWARGAKGGRDSKVVIANIYDDGRWNRMELWHPECYERAGSPHGLPIPSPPSTVGQLRHRSRDVAEILA
jgi:hypothetical protein